MGLSFRFQPISFTFKSSNTWQKKYVWSKSLFVFLSMSKPTNCKEDFSKHVHSQINWGRVSLTKEGLAVEFGATWVQDERNEVDSHMRPVSNRKKDMKCSWRVKSWQIIWKPHCEQTGYSEINGRALCSC